MERRLRTPYALRQAEDSTADGSFTRYDLGGSHYLNRYAIQVSAAILRPGKLQRELADTEASVKNEQFALVDQEANDVGPYGGDVSLSLRMSAIE
jgi:hypothetical protein